MHHSSFLLKLRGLQIQFRLRLNLLTCADILFERRMNNSSTELINVYSPLLLGRRDSNASASSLMHSPPFLPEGQLLPTVFFLLAVMGVCVLILHLLIKYELHFIPESLAVIAVGALFGAVILILSKVGFISSTANGAFFAFPERAFSYLLLPPIVFEAGYSMSKADFFHNIGSILVFAVPGTTISAAVIGCGLYLVGWLGLSPSYSLVDLLAFGSLISAVDPVATLNIFRALNADHVLYIFAPFWLFIFLKSIAPLQVTGYRLFCIHLQSFHLPHIQGSGYIIVIYILTLFSILI